MRRDVAQLAAARTYSVCCSMNTLKQWQCLPDGATAKLEHTLVN